MNNDVHMQVLTKHRKHDEIIAAVKLLKSQTDIVVGLDVCGRHIQIDDLQQEDKENLGIFLESYGDYLKFTELHLKATLSCD